LLHKGENSPKEWHDSFGLNIWWNLNMLRDIVRQAEL
jgi:hypothetical protein